MLMLIIFFIKFLKFVEMYPYIMSLSLLNTLYMLIFLSQVVPRQDSTVRTVLYRVHVTARRVTVTSQKGIVSVVSLDTEVLHATTVNKLNLSCLNR